MKVLNVLQPTSCRAPVNVNVSAAAAPLKPLRARQALRTRLQSVSQDTLTAATGPSQQAAASSPQELHPESWQQCVQRVQDLGFSEADAGCSYSGLLAGAPKHGPTGGMKREEAPDAAQIEAVLEFLQQQLGMDELQVSKAVKAFPEVLGCAVGSQLQGNVAKLQQEWKLEGQVLRGAVLRNPALLGYNVDCLGDCAGECNRCWVRF